ncbi:MAG: VPLPA-CTERM sorting domain-containing protein [Pseudomonadota bacterium]
MRMFLAALGSVLAGPVLAASVTVSDFSAAAYNAAVGPGNAVVQNFEDYAEGNVADGFMTNVGTFATAGGTGTGGTIKKADFANDGSQLAIRDGHVFGRRSTTLHLTGNASDDTFLDSNDTLGILWDVNIGTAFDRIILTLTDAADVNAILTIGGAGITSVDLQDLSNGTKKIVEIDFGKSVNSASVFFRNDRLNDGFSLDDIAVSEVPLPASMLLLLGGLGGLSLLRRRSA